LFNQEQGGVAGLVFPIALFILVFYFLIFRPQKKKQQQHDKMISSISRGDTVVSAGGIFGRVSDVLDDSYIIEIAEGVRIRIMKSSISVRREGADTKPRPSRPKKKRREGGRPEPAEGETTAERAIDEGVTPEENSALNDRTSGGV
jgi:preprotein translocase subunit YajC